MLQLCCCTYAVVLVGGDCGENGLTKDECLVYFAIELRNGRVGQALLAAVFSPPQNQVDPRLVLVHGVQHDLGEFGVSGLSVCRFVGSSGCRVAPAARRRWAPRPSAAHAQPAHRCQVARPASCSRPGKQTNFRAAKHSVSNWPTRCSFCNSHMSDKSQLKRPDMLGPGQPDEADEAHSFWPGHTASSG